MFLAIDISLIDGCAIYYSTDARTWKKEEYFQGLLVAINTVLGEQGKSIDELKGIILLVGSGRFTANRVGAVVVNMLALTHSIPVRAVSKLELEKAYQLFAQIDAPRFILPVYSAPPRALPQTSVIL